MNFILTSTLRILIVPEDGVHIPVDREVGEGICANFATQAQKDSVPASGGERRDWHTGDVDGDVAGSGTKLFHCRALHQPSRNSSTALP